MNLFEKKQHRIPHDAIGRPVYWLAFKQIEMPKESETEMMTLILIGFNSLVLYKGVWREKWLVQGHQASIHNPDQNPVF